LLAALVKDKGSMSLMSLPECSECGKTISEREGKVCDACYKANFFTEYVDAD
jgi:NMD protein affecting ribosome stability and mRNA decay